MKAKASSLLHFADEFKKLRTLYSSVGPPFAGVIASCVALMSKFESVELTHVYREKNVAANCLANWSLNMDLGVCYFDEAPVWISSILIDDLLGAVKPQMISVS
ncbi:hypothetical protein L3X38_023572 [Prunus dulcis]|uniref:RNase H type-1 domain-containing protein n=1 Tax=Prunus dulcis TaxID=3755 RepID=A0AAD4Z5G0_PRUDU|nr:hypothetical protein L3X38_023572 [Prunus dulcis]